MSYKLQYKHEFQNVEGKNVVTIIEDTHSGLANPYNVNIEYIDIGSVTLLIRIFFNNIPADATGIQFYYSDDGGATWTVIFGTDMTSPKEFTLPNTTQYLFRMVIQFADSSQNITVNLNELEPVIRLLQPANDPYRLINNNGERKKYGIVGTQAVIRFHSSPEININSFISGTYDDRRYRVTTYIDDEAYVIFRGFLALSESQDVFLPHPVDTELRAVDGLGFLKNIPLTMPDGSTPEDEYQIIKYLVWALAKTGLERNLNVVMNIREEDSGTIAADPNGHFYLTQYLDPKTFEDEPGTCENCYAVLEKILGKSCRLGQRHGEWWIKNTDEYDSQPDYVTEFDPNGDIVEVHEGAYYNKEIGNGDTWNSFLSQERAIVNFFNPSKFGMLKYRLETPKEVPSNIDFTRGAFIADISADAKKFELDDWEQLWSDEFTDEPGFADIHVRRNYLYGYEKELFLVIPASDKFHFVMSKPIPVTAGDKFSLDVQMRLNANPGGTGIRRAISTQVRLYADDGTFYTYKSLTSVTDQREWKQCFSDFKTNQRTLVHEWYAEEDITNPVSLFDGEGLPFPKTGYIRLLFYANSLYALTHDTYLNARFEYIPLINGAFRKYSSVSHKVEQAANNNESYEEEIHICDQVKPLFKGSLKKLVGGKYISSERFWNAAVFPGGVPSDDYLHPYGYIEAFNLWNQRRMVQRIFSGSIQGIDTDELDDLNRSDLFSLFHTYILRDPSDHTNNKKFMLLDFDMDLKLCELNSFTLAEVYDTVLGKKYDDPYTFKYLTE